MSKLKGCFTSLALTSEIESFHTIREVEELLGSEKPSIYNLVNEGTLRCVEIGRGNRIQHHSAVSEFVAKNIKPRVAYPSRGRTQRGARA